MTADKPDLTHGSMELDEDAAKLVALGADPGLAFVVCGVCGGDGAFDESGDRWRMCVACDGAGFVDIAPRAIDIEDLDAIGGELSDEC